MRTIPRDAVGRLLAEVADTAILPRYQNLRADDISTKSSETDFVTIADREAEAWLTPRLQSILDCPVIGEEAVALNPDLRDKAGTGLVWTVDPVDGTANFVKGNERFCVMVALASDGVPQQSWIWLPLERALYHAVAGGGAEKVLDGTTSSLSAAASSPSFDALVGGGNVKGLEGEQKDLIQQRLRTLPGRRFTGSAGVQASMLASGSDDYMAHGRCTPWDHAPVDLLCREAGCHAAIVTTGAPYHTGNNEPFMVTANQDIWNHLADTLWAGFGA